MQKENFKFLIKLKRNIKKNKTSIEEDIYQKIIAVEEIDRFKKKK